MDGVPFTPGEDIEGIRLGVLALEDDEGTRGGVENISLTRAPRSFRGGDVTEDRLPLPRSEGILDIDPGGDVMFIVRAGGGVLVGDCVGVDPGVKSPEGAELRLARGADRELSADLSWRALVGVVCASSAGVSVIIDETKEDEDPE